jgi:non-reducing end alpha-L-arabinofuranosidase
VVTLAGQARYSYCVSANQMTFSVLGESPTTTGTVAFQKGSSGGSGGSPGTGGASGKGGSTGAGGSTSSPGLPCDIYASEAGPCVAAHSTVRALSAAYGGPLYQVRRDDGRFRDIPVLSPGGFVDSSVQDAFCGPTGCTISVIYDQSGKGNHLTKAPPGGAKPTPGNEADAKVIAATFNGHPVYGVYIAPGVGYRNNLTVGPATGDNPETIYMVASGKNYNSGCCFDYGNAETDNNDNGNGAVEAVYFGSCNIWGKGSGPGPWVMGDLENGLWPGSERTNQSNPSVTYDFVTAMVKGGLAGANHWTIKVGDAQSGDLAAVFDGSRPNGGYATMRKEGAIILGIAGDNSNGGRGTFFEGVMTAHYASDAADSAVQASIVSAYGR